MKMVKQSMKAGIGIHLAAVLCCAASVAARADFAIDVDMSADPIKDVRTSTCGPEVGYAGCLMQYKGWYGTDVGEEYWFRTDGGDYERAKALVRASSASEDSTPTPAPTESPNFTETPVSSPEPSPEPAPCQKNLWNPL